MLELLVRPRIQGILRRESSPTSGCHNSGISGGGFALVRMPNNTFEAIDFREEAPAAAFTKMFDGNNRGSMVGGNATYVINALLGPKRL